MQFFHSNYQTLSTKQTPNGTKDYHQTTSVKEQTTPQTASSKLNNRRTIIENQSKKNATLNNHSHRNLTKSRSAGGNSDSSVSSCSSTKKVNSSPKAEKASKSVKLSPTPPPVDECEVVGELVKAPMLPIVSEPEAEVVVVEAVNNKVSNSKAIKKLGRQNTVAAIHNENLSQQRKNYLNQQKSQVNFYSDFFVKKNNIIWRTSEYMKRLIILIHASYLFS